MDDERKLSAHGGQRIKGNQACNTSLKYGTADYWLARLERDDHAELAAKVRARVMSANAAAVIMGWRTRPPKYPRSRPIAISALIG
jgi:hypothetical protein